MNRRLLILAGIGCLVLVIAAAGIGYAVGTGHGRDDARAEAAAALADQRLAACRTFEATDLRVRTAVWPLLQHGDFAQVPQAMSLAGTDRIDEVAESTAVTDDVAEAFRGLSARYTAVATFAAAAAADDSFTQPDSSGVRERAQLAADQVAGLCG